MCYTIYTVIYQDYQDFGSFSDYIHDMNKDIKNNIINMLKSAGIENYLFETKIIEEYADKNNFDGFAIENMVRRRINREPLQYIIGEWEFYGDVYKLNKDCLIPRPETEFLTEYIINNANKNGVILDLCCGSGCVSISALKRRKDLSAILIDISQGAIEAANINSELNGVSDRLQSYRLDIMQDFDKIKNIIKSKNLSIDMITSNPPYLTKSEVVKIKAEKTELYYEPEIAFSGGDDGLDFYRFIINNYSQICGEIVLEAGINQYKDIVAMFDKIGFSCGIIRDYGKIERVVAGRKR